MRRVGIIGHYGGEEVFLDGQTVKTKIITTELKRQLGEEEVLTIDTYGGKKALIKCAFGSMGLLKKCKNVIMLPAHNGIRFFTPVLLFWNRFFQRKLHYIVIGGWLPEFLTKKLRLSNQLKKFDYIYVETNAMKKALDAIGFVNVIIMPNCKDLKILNPEELIYPDAEPYKLCTFSRVMKEKGIEEAVNAVRVINQEKGRTVFELDIYGQVEVKQKEWFDNLQKSFPEYIRYKGVIPYEQSTETLKEYFALLFPTKFYTEGIPGTVIDAYAAGIPVIGTKWENFDDIIVSKITGIEVRFNDYEDLLQVLRKASEKPTEFIDMKSACLKKAVDFSAHTVVGTLIGGGVL